MSDEILTPQSPRWDEFAEALAEALSVPGRPEAWRCDGARGDLRYRYAKQVMADMGNVDVEGTLAYFAANGGACCCEILLNVDRVPDLAS